MDKNITFFIIMGCLLAFLPTKAQDQLAYYQKKYPKAEEVILEQSNHIYITKTKGELHIREERSKTRLFLTDMAIKNARESVSHNSFYTIEALEAASFVPYKKRYKKLAVKEFKEKDNMGDFFYDDSKSTHFFYPNLQKGAKTKLRYTGMIKNPRFLSGIYLQSYIPIVSHRVVIEVDKDVELEFNTFHTSEGHFRIDSVQKGSKTIYSIQIKEQDAFAFESESPDYKYSIPHIIPRITQYRIDGKTTKVSQTVKDLYAWYFGLVKDVNKQQVDAELKALVHRLIADKKTDLEKVAALYKWVQDEIKYIAFEYALGGFIPREANAVFEKKYGDCKDNSSIMQQMLQVAGLESYLTWIGTRSLPYSYEELPTPMVDNHMILAYKDGLDFYFLDATGKYLPLDMPSPFIQGKEALVGLSADSYAIEKVPVIPAKRNTIWEEATLVLDKGVLKGKATTTFGGYPKIRLFNLLEKLQKQGDKKSFFRSILEKGNNSCAVQDIQEKGVFSYEEDYRIQHRYQVDKYYKTIGEDIYINMNLRKETGRLRWNKERKQAFEQSFKRQFRYTYRLEIPEDYRLSYKPEDFYCRSDGIEAKISYKLQGQTLVYTHHLKLDFLLLTVDEIHEMRKHIKNINKAYREVVVLQKN
ncbi:MAG: DUF3857 and transglutaminase domain-containing protein [Flavobacteriaceae bacterium]|nr:DUF3857 and transglutaminase domain-containing protein [Flavobacteriaceae bacterium]